MIGISANKPRVASASHRQRLPPRADVDRNPRFIPHAAPLGTSPWEPRKSIPRHGFRLRAGTPCSHPSISTASSQRRPPIREAEWRLPGVRHVVAGKDRVPSEPLRLVGSCQCSGFGFQTLGVAAHKEVPFPAFAPVIDDLAPATGPLGAWSLHPHQLTSGRSPRSCAASSSYCELPVHSVLYRWLAGRRPGF